MYKLLVCFGNLLEDCLQLGFYEIIPSRIYCSVNIGAFLCKMCKLNFFQYPSELTHVFSSCSRSLKGILELVAKEDKRTRLVDPLWLVQRTLFSYGCERFPITVATTAF